MINLLSKLESLCFYREALENDEIFKEFYHLVKTLAHPEPIISEAQNAFFSLRSKLANYALMIADPVAPTVWQNFIIDLLTKENSITVTLENNKSFPYSNTLKDDLLIFSEIYNFDFKQLVNWLSPNTENIFNKKIFDNETELAKALRSKRKNKIYEALISYLTENGIGLYKNQKVFRVRDQEEILYPISVTKIKPFDEIIGYETQKEKVIKNTESFINDSGGLNILLYGDMGTGKSTMIKALIDRFKDTPLRFIELKKNEFHLIPALYDQIRRSSYPFILFIDDLSFNDGDDSYRDLKIALEGSFEEFPENLLIYATSNKRTLISQSKSEREDAVNAREIIEEKNSLVSRFGLTIPFTVPKQDDYLEIVKFLAKQNGIDYTDELRERAIQWELRHMNRSGRTAEQFIQSEKTAMSSLLPE